MRDAQRHAYGLIPLLNLLESHGVNVDNFLKQVQIPAFGITDPTYTIGLEREVEIVTEALALVNSETVGLELAKHTRLNNFSVYGLAIRACSNLSEVQQLSLRYRDLAWGNCNIRVERRDDVIATFFESGSLHVDHALAVRDMACAVLLMGEASGKRTPLREVHFAFAAPQDSAAYRQVFHCPVRFDQPEHALWIPIEAYDQTLPNADPRARSFYEAQCAIMSKALQKPFSYTETLRDRLYRTTPIPGLEEIAETLNMTPRTLQRRLKAENTLFSELLQEVRQQRAMESLAEGQLSLERIGEALGFRDSVAFYHAFKKWTGTSPSKWRKDHSQRE